MTSTLPSIKPIEGSVTQPKRKPPWTTHSVDTIATARSTDEFASNHVSPITNHFLRATDEKAPSNVTSQCNTPRDMDRLFVPRDCDHTDGHGDVLRSSSNWDFFIEHINRIDDSSMLYSKPLESNKLKLRSSRIFENVMGDVQRMIQERLRISAARELKAAQSINKIDERTSECSEDISEESHDVTDEYDWSDIEHEDDGLDPRKRAAKRAWSIIRNNVQEVARERKKQKSTFNWSFLRQHINNMTDTEKARKDLYDKYLDNRNGWASGLTHYPHDIIKQSDRNRSWVYVTATVPTAAKAKRSRPGTATSRGSSRKSVPKQKPRPFTAPNGGNGPKTAHKNAVNSKVERRRLLTSGSQVTER